MRKGLIMLAAAMLFSWVSMAQSIETLDVSKLSDGPYSKVFNEYRIEGQVKNGQKDGFWCEYYTKNEMLHRMIQYHNGTMNGQYLELDDTGALLKQQAYENGKLNGASYIWLQAARLVQKNQYKNGEYDGDQYIYYDNGNKQESASYKNGQRDGQTIWYNRDGAKRMMITYEKGLFEGVQETYYPSGAVMSSKMYKNNVLDGEAVEYYEGGDVKSTATYKKGVLSGKVKTFEEKNPVNDVKITKDKEKMDSKIIGEEKKISIEGKKDAKVVAPFELKKDKEDNAVKKVKKG